MYNLQQNITNYLDYCLNQKRLNSKTLKAYRIDLTQFQSFINISNVRDITIPVLEDYISFLNKEYSPKTVKRKIASIKAFFRYLEYKDIILINPFYKMQIKFREPFVLPKTIPLNAIELLLKTIYSQQYNAKTAYQKQMAIRDAAIIELLFSTGIRISELCALKEADINLYDKTLLIYGKGNKERILHIGNDDVIRTLKIYQTTFKNQIQLCNHFFSNVKGTPLSDQAVRNMINKYCNIASIHLHITPHMFRHTFATSLLEADVDIRYIQEMLGHSSINITEIYTHVATAKQKTILATKHPRKNFKIM